MSLLATFKEPKGWLDAAQKACPLPYKLTDTGVWNNGVCVTRTPMMLEAIFDDTATGERMLRMAWVTRTASGLKVKRHVAPRASWTTAHALSKMASHGVDGGGHNSQKMARYVAAMEASAADSCHLDSTRRLGWDDSMTRFLWGEACLSGDEILPADPFGPLDQASLYLATTTPRAAVEGLYTEGSEQEWLKAARIAGGHPRAALAIYAALVPPMLKILGAENFAVQWAGASSTGKSTAIALASSVWGNPDPLAPMSFTGLWNETLRSLELGAAALSDLPFILDEMRTTRVRDAADKARLVVGGVSRGVSEDGSHERMAQWNTVVVSAGMANLEDDDASEALNARSLTLWGSPFGRPSPESAKDVAAITVLVRRNFGHLGPNFVQKLMANQHLWPKWKAAYDAAYSSATSKGAAMGGMAGRCAGHIACIATVAQVAHALMPELDWDYKPTIHDLWTWLALNGPRTSRATLAYTHIKEWIGSQWWNLCGADPSQAEPKGGWVGIVRTGGLVSIPHSILVRELADAGFDHAGIFAEWARSGLIQRGAGVPWRTITLAGRATRAVCFSEPMGKVRPLKTATA